MMQDCLREIIKLSSFAKIEGLKVIGTPRSTRVSAVDEDRELIINVELKEPVPEFEGTFGIPHLKLLDSLLGFDKYQKGTVEIKRFTRTNREEDGTEKVVEVPQSITFTDAKGGSANVWFNHGQSLPPGADTDKLRWDVSFEVSKGAIAEFNKMSSIFSTPECRVFGMKTVDGALRFTFGIEGATTHYGEMVFEEGVSGTVVGNQYWDSAKFTASVKAALGSGNPITLSITNRLLCVSTETEFGHYRYFLRTQKAPDE